MGVEGRGLRVWGLREKSNTRHCRFSESGLISGAVTKDDEALKRQAGLEHLGSRDGKLKVACASETSLVSHFHFLPGHCLRTWQGTEEVSATTAAQQT